ncbi:3-isopropylmalate dehydratase small subunit [Variovorax atrisoli]|uniref:3-isopropylmalate dehydratase small subunit n=1 Tax=Variovorax atrisoli TaxID=3394203 RepID=UPI0033917F3D
MTGRAAPLLRDNIDTDSLIPSREMTSPTQQGYGEKLLASWRYLPTDDGSRKENPNFVLNRAPFRDASVLIAGDNFGCGSSREAAAWALRQFGFRAVLAASFGTIFQNNCYRNGLLPIVMPRAELDSLAAEAEQGALDITVDLERQVVEAPGGRSWPIAIPASEREMMLAGLDAIGLTLRLREQIEAFQQADRAARPWIWLASPAQET